MKQTLTAGHTLQGLDECLSKGKLTLVNSYLLAGFGPDVKSHTASKHPIYFDYEKTERGYLHQDGLDFGLLNLGTYLQSHLEANGVEPVREENWRIPINLEFEDCIMLGFPQEFVELGELNPTMLRVTQIHDVPEDVEQPPWPRFVGKLGDRFPLKTLVGMSGGPIYGFNPHQHPDKYWIPAIQSGWLPTRRIIFGCPVPLLARLAEEYLSRRARSGESIPESE